MILRNTIGALAVGILALGTVSAATIQTQIGGANGLTSSFLSSGSCANLACGLVGTTLPTEVNYDSTVFSGALNGATAPTPYVGYGTGSGGTLFDSAGEGGAGVTFSMINESNSSLNAWSLASAQATSASIIIPVGLFGVTDIWTMTNLFEGGALAREYTVVLNFGPTKTATTGNTTVTIRPINTNSPANSTAINTSRDAIDCSGGSGCTGATTPGNPDGAVGAPATFNTTFGSGSGQVNSAGAQTGLSGVTIVSDNVFTMSYDSATGAYANTTGNLNLDDQGFLFTGSLATFAANNWLQSVTIRDNGTTAGSKLFLSALTVDSLATPEPSTVFLLLTGFGAIGLKRFRRS